MTRTLRHLLLLLLLLGLAAPSAFAAPGDAAPTFGDDDDDDDDEEEEAEEEEAVEEEPVEEDEPADEEPADEEPADEDEPADDATEEEDADEDDASDEEYDPLKGLDLPPSGDTSPTDSVDEEEDEGDDDDDDDDASDGDEVEDDELASDSSAARRAARDAKKKKDRKKNIIKVIQKKFFLKYRRLELTPHVGYVGNDNFITRLHLGLAATYHINDLLGIELMVAGLPNLGNTDYKPLTRRFQRESEVVPDITRVTFEATLGGAVSPIYGKVELGTSRIINYDIYFIAGAGMVHTRDDTEIIKSQCNDLPTVRERKDRSNAIVAENGCWLVDQEHFASYFGGGLRIVFNKWIGIRLDVRNMTHIEQAWRNGDVGLEMKHTLNVNVGASFFIPPEPRRLN